MNWKRMEAFNLSEIDRKQGTKTVGTGYLNEYFMI